MFSRKTIRLSVFVALVGTLAVYAYVVPASNVGPTANVERAPFIERSGVASSTRPWSEGLSEGAVDSGGIEKDLDGNASALLPADQLR